MQRRQRGRALLQQVLPFAIEVAEQPFDARHVAHRLGEGARELLDFPRLMAREKAQRARRDAAAPLGRKDTPGRSSDHP